MHFYKYLQAIVLLCASLCSANGLYKVHWYSDKKPMETLAVRSELEDEVVGQFTHVYRSTFSSKFARVTKHVQHPQLNARRERVFDVDSVNAREKTFVLRRVIANGPKALLVQMHKHETLTNQIQPEKNGCRVGDSQYQGIVYDQETDSYGNIATHVCNGRLDGVLSLPNKMYRVSGMNNAIVLDYIEDNDFEFRDTIIETLESKKQVHTTSVTATNLIFPIHIVHDSFRDDVYQDEYNMALQAMLAVNVADMQYNRANQTPHVRIVVKGMTVLKTTLPNTPGTQPAVLQTIMPRISSGVPTITSAEEYLREGQIAWAITAESGITPNVVPVLFTGQPQLGIAGMATLGTACSEGAGVLLQAQYNSSPSITGLVLAHELGHIAGIPHDEDLTSITDKGSIIPCPQPSPYLMSSITDKTSVAWSACSKFLWTASASSIMSCFTNDEAGAFTLGVCGNGIIEPGEQCDCKLEDCSDDPCCDKNKCRLKTGASCSKTQACCTDCKVANSMQSCRGTHHPLCDVSEVCDGYSADCPENQSRNQGFWCSGDHYAREGSLIGRCYDGRCTTAASICWGLGKVECTEMVSDCNAVYCKDRPALASGFRTLSTSGTSDACQNVVKVARISNGLSCPNNGQCMNGDCVYTLPTEYETESAGQFDMSKSWSIVVVTILGSLVFASAGVMQYAFQPTDMFTIKSPTMEADDTPVLPVRVTAANALHQSRQQNNRSSTSTQAPPNPNSRR